MGANTLKIGFILAGHLCLVLFLSGCAGGGLTQNERDSHFSEAVLAYDSGNYHHARRLWLHLAKDHNLSAMVNLGVLYEYGRGVARDAQTARIWYERAAKRGYISAQLRLAALFERDAPEKAFFWNRWAGVAGSPVGLYRAGLYLFEHRDDIAGACKLMTDAARYGMKEARVWLVRHGVHLRGSGSEIICAGLFPSGAETHIEETL